MPDPNNIGPAEFTAAITNFTVDITMKGFALAKDGGGSITVDKDARSIVFESIGAGATLRYVAPNGAVCTLTPQFAGAQYDVQIAKILATGTTGITRAVLVW